MIDFRYPEFERFYAYWDTLRGKSLVPSRIDLKYTQIPDLAENISVLDISSSDKVRYAFVGSGPVDRLDGDVTGKDALAMFRPEIAAASDRIIRLMGAHPIGTVSLYAAPALANDLAFEVISLPVLASDGRPTLIANLGLLKGANRQELSFAAIAPKVTQYDVTTIDIGAGVPDDL